LSILMVCPVPSSSLLLPVDCSFDHPVLLSFPTRRSSDLRRHRPGPVRHRRRVGGAARGHAAVHRLDDGGHYGDIRRGAARHRLRSEEHTSELQSLAYLVCRLLLEKKKYKRSSAISKAGSS